MFYYYRRQIRAVVIVAVLAALVYGGIKLTMYYKVDRALEDLETELAGRAELTHGDIDTSITGEVRIHQLRVLPTGSPEPVSIDVVRITGPHVGYFLWEQDSKPAHLAMSMSGIHVPLDPALFDAMTEQMGAGAPAGNPDQPVADGCGSQGGMDPALLRDLGMTELSMDVDMAYRLDKERRRLEANVALQIEDIEDVQASLALGDVPPDILDGQPELTSLPTLAGAELRVNVTPAFAERYLAACAAKRGQSVSDYRTSLVDEVTRNLALFGVKLGPGLADAVQTYHHQWGEVALTIAPDEPVNLLGLMFSNPTDWQQSLGMGLKLNGAPVTDLRFELKPAEADELAVLMGKEPRPKPPEPRDRYRYVYRSVPVGSIAQHIGADVRVQVRNQPDRTGVLKGLNATEAQVEQRLQGGKITAHVLLDEITGLEVRQVEKIPAKK